MKNRIAQWSLILSIIVITFAVIWLQFEVASLTQQLEECKARCATCAEK